MRKVKFFAVLMCITVLGAESVLTINAAEMRATPCLDRNCSGIIITKRVDRAIPDHQDICQIHENCIVSYSNIVMHEKVTCCSECGKVYNTEVLGSTMTQMHSNPVDIH